MSPVSVPTEKDWGDYQSDLDQKDAHDLFAGHTNEQMRSNFRDNPIERACELQFMPETPFQYYMLGFRDFVMARDFDSFDLSDAASCFLNLVIEKLEKQPQHIIPIMRELLPAIEYVAHNQAQFEAEEEFYGNFLDRLTRIQALYVPHSGS